MLSKILEHFVFQGNMICPWFNPSNAVATFAQGTRMPRFFKTIKKPVMLVLIGKLLMSTLR